MNYFVKICILYSIIHNTEGRALAGVKRTFQFELVPFKQLSFFLEHVSPLGKFELKHSLEKRETLDDIIPNEIPVPEPEKKVLLTSVVAPPVEVAPAPVPVAVPEKKPDVVPFVIELAPKPVPAPAPVPAPVPVVPEPVPVVPVVPKVPVMYTDITQIPMYNFAFPQPIPIQVPYPMQLEVPVKPEPVVAPVEVPAVPAVPAVPVEPVPVFTEPPVVEVKPEVVPVPETKPVPPLPTYVIKGSRLILFFGSKILQMLSQFVDGKSFAEFTLPPPPPLPVIAKKK